MSLLHTDVSGEYEHPDNKHKQRRVNARDERAPVEWGSTYLSSGDNGADPTPGWYSRDDLENSHHTDWDGFYVQQARMKGAEYTGIAYDLDLCKPRYLATTQFGVIEFIRPPRRQEVGH